MASGALPSHRYRRKDSRAASALYHPRRPGGPVRRLWDRARNVLAAAPINMNRVGGGRRATTRLVSLLYLLVFLVIVLALVPLPEGSTLSATRLALLGSETSLWSLLLPGGGGGEGGEGGSNTLMLSSADVLRYVDPLIGTAGGGHVFAGATVPYGMAKPVADSVDRKENAGGYITDFSHISGFSQLHDSGTGGAPSLGNFPLFVHPGCPLDELSLCTYTAATRAVMRWPYSAQASPGYFSIRLKNSVAAEMTATHHTSLYRFSFPDGDASENGNGMDVDFSPLILIDLQDLDSSRHGGGVRVDPSTGRITGQGQFRPSFGTGNYEAFFCADFRGASIRRSGTFMGDNPDEERQVLEEDPSGEFHVPRGSAGGWVQFEAPKKAAKKKKEKGSRSGMSSSSSREILARVGMSFLSRERACQNAEREVPKFDFERTVSLAEEAWREKLAVVKVDETDVDPALLVTFWSGLYRTMVSPQDYSGENQLWESGEPYFDSFYCIWDSFRAQHPLLSIIDPVAQTKMVRTLIDIYRHLGKLPDCRMSFSKGFTQGGTNADVVIGDAYIKGITDGVDWDTAYEAVVSDAEVEPKNWNVEGRGNLVSYHALGYIPSDDVDTNGTGRNTRTVSRTVEYAYEDFAIAQLAKSLGHEADYRKYMQRSTNWRNLWNAAQEDVLITKKKGSNSENFDAAPAAVEEEFIWSDFTGFLQPRQLDGQFVYAHPRTCSPINDRHKCYLDTKQATYEGSPWLYSFYVPQDMASLITAMGGPKLFTERLEYLHESGLLDMGNEQSFLPVFQFHYAGRPGLSAYWVHRYIPSLFNTTFAGVPGNDDCAMGAFSGFAMMGFFPVAGQDVYLLTAPFFREVRLRARNGRNRWAVIKVVNFDPTYGARYIQSATLNGRAYTRSWIGHEFFMKGGVLEVVVGRSESRTWGTAAEDLPPSWGWKAGSD